MENKVRKVLQSFEDIFANQRLLIACSGGADSMALCHVLCALREIFCWEIIIAHFNHIVRGGEAERDKLFVQAMAAERGLPFICGRMDWRGAAFSEDKARTARYDFLRKTAHEQGARGIALGHNRDDSMETLLINLLRGGGSAGLKGISFVREGIFIRPLIDIERAEIFSYLRKNKCAFIEDGTNTDQKYLRNKIRHTLLPLLEKEYSPRASAHISRAAEILAGENDYIDGQANEFLGRCAREENREVIEINALRALHPALRARVLRLTAQRAAGEKGGIYYAHIHALLHLVESVEGSQEAHLPRGVMARREYGKIFFLRETGENQHDDFNVFVATPSEMEVAKTRMRFSVVSASEVSFNNPEVSFLDRDKIAEPLMLRSWRAGDKIKPLGMRGHSRSLQDIFTDRKIPSAQRARLPLLVSAQEVLWIPRVAVSESARIDETSQRALKVEILP